MNNVCRHMDPHICASCGHKYALPYKLREFCLADSCCSHLWALPDTLQQSVPSWQEVCLGTDEEFKVLHSSGQMALRPCPVFTPLVAGSLKDVLQGSELIDAWGVDLKSSRVCSMESPGSLKTTVLISCSHSQTFNQYDSRSESWDFEKHPPCK